MRKGKFKFTNKEGIEEQVALETLLDQIVDSPIRALMPYTEYRKGEIIFDKELPLCFWVCVGTGMTGDKSSLNVLKESKSYGTVVECGHAMFITHLTQYIPTMKTFDAYAKLESPHLTGTPTAPTASSDTNTTQIATTEFVKTALAAFNLTEYLKVADAQRTYAPLNSPRLTGTPVAPTPNDISEDTSIATTEWVKRVINISGGGIVAANLNQNGYVKFANGLILQWGVTSDNATITYPIRFNTVYVVLATTNTYQGNRLNGRPADTCGVIVESFTTTQAMIYKAVMHSEQYNSGNGNQQFSGYWFAIGR